VSAPPHAVSKIDSSSKLRACKYFLLIVLWFSFGTGLVI
jgi:hypothetical protein